MTSINPTNPDALTDAPQGKDQPYGDPVQPGEFFVKSPKQIGQRVRQAWEANKESYTRWQAEWVVNARRRAGETNVWVQKTTNQASWQVYAPPGGGKNPPAVLNKADRLCQRLINVVYADPPVPEPVPATGEDSDRDAAEFAARVLIDIQSESGVNDLEAARCAMDMAGASRSAFVHYWVDPQAGGRQPVEVLASPLAQSEQEALVDPQSGQPWPGDLVTRWVGPGGELLDSPEGAALQWVPKLTRHVLHPSAVRLIPWTAEDIWAAEGVILGRYRPFAELQKDYPETLAGADVETVTGYRPAAFKELLPKRGHKTYDPTPEDTSQRLALELTVYLKEAPDYPDGCHLVLVGEDQLARPAEPWVGKRLGKREALDLPVSQYRQFRGPPGDPHGRGLMDLLGMSNEFRGHLVGIIEDILDRNANRKVFIPTNSLLQAKQHMLPMMTYIPINPGGEPKMEDLIPVPPEAVTLLELVTREMDDASGLQETGQGLEAKGVNSGRQALAIVSQVHAGLSDLKANAERAFIRGSRIQLQLVGNKYTVPQQIRWQGPDGSYKVKRFLGSDLGSTRDVRLKPGTMTMMTPLQKATTATEYMQMGLLDPADLKDILEGSLGSTIGLQDNPHLQRVRRQCAAWREGPPEGWVEQAKAQQQQAVMQAQQMAQAQAMAPPPMDPMGQPLPVPPPMPPAPPPPPQAPPDFAPVPADAMPPVATLRVREIGKVMAGTAYSQADPLWRGVLDALFAAAQQAIQPMPASPPPSGGGGPPAQAPGPTSAPPPLMPSEADVLGTSATAPAGL